MIDPSSTPTAKKSVDAGILNTSISRQPIMYALVTDSPLIGREAPTLDELMNNKRPCGIKITTSRKKQKATNNPLPIVATSLSTPSAIPTTLAQTP
ncbi:hypothetical protein GQ55_2G201000 [Panicum hallii var. hallii]|uniref:Uncharacterized protein n=1 Tax=Panicum hallii var. hallii TaxID=1504633 RepID=A0A2T7EQM5_9POAL|nr:hypothetical protein GQ55_2G201000 [Panicum hallii var. hallii]